MIIIMIIIIIIINIHHGRLVWVVSVWVQQRQCLRSPRLANAVH